MRQFFLENEIGQKHDLNNVRNGFFSEPEGLGYEMETSYIKVGSVWVRQKYTDTQSKISGNLVFGGSPYEAAAEFFKFIRMSKEITLHRITPAGEFLKDVDISTIEVTEIGEGDYLTVPVTFICRSLWYEKVAQRYAFGTTGVGRVMRYSYRLSSRFKDATTGMITIENDGSVPAPLRITADGAIANPVITLSQGGEDLYSVAISGTASAGEQIRWSSVDGDLYCELVSGEDHENLVPGFDITNANFFKVPVGTSTVTVTADDAILSPINLTMYKYFRAV